MTNPIIIKLHSEDTRVLDDSVRKIVSTLDVDSHVTVLPVILDKVRLLQRKISISQPSKNTIKILEKIDIPQNVKIFVS
jgi:ribosomal protein S10